MSPSYSDLDPALHSILGHITGTLEHDIPQLNPSRGGTKTERERAVEIEPTM